MYFYEKLLRMTIDSTDLSQRDIARAIGVPATTLNEWLLSGVKPHVKNLIRLSEWSKVPLPALLVDTETPDALDERMIILAAYLTEEQKAQIVKEMELMTEANKATVPDVLK